MERDGIIVEESPFFPIGQVSTKCANVIFGNVAQYVHGSPRLT